jgi:hypothetical protein
MELVALELILLDGNTRREGHTEQYYSAHHSVVHVDQVVLFGITSATSIRHSHISNNTKSRQRHSRYGQVNKQVKDQAITTTSHKAREGTSLVSNAHGICLEKASIRVHSGSSVASIIRSDHLSICKPSTS